MRIDLASFCLGAVLFVSPLQAMEASLLKAEKFFGMCDASAAVALSKDIFVVANDEDNFLRLYRNGHSRPVQSFDLSHRLELAAKNPELDLEGAARCGKYIYWIGSHGRNKAGKARPNRHRLFATSFTLNGKEMEMEVIGRPYPSLVDDLVREPRFREFHFAEASERAPKKRGALNIEGLCATPENHLLIGFRNPVPDGKTLLIPLLNPEAVIAGQRAKFGEAILLDLNGLAIRDIVFHERRYFIIAGPFDGAGKSELYSWAGVGSKPRRVTGVEFGKNNPEAIFADLGKPGLNFHVLLDHGTKMIGEVPCKEAAEVGSRFFEGFSISIRD